MEPIVIKMDIQQAFDWICDLKKTAFINENIRHADLDILIFELQERGYDVVERHH